MVAYYTCFSPSCLFHLNNIPGDHSKVVYRVYIPHSFYSYIILLHVDVLQLIQTVLYWWTFVFFNLLLLHIKLQWIIYCICFTVFLPVYPWDTFLEVGLQGQREKALCNFARFDNFPSIGVVLFYIPTIKAWECLFRASPKTMWSNLLLFANLISEKLYLILVLIYTSLMSKVEYYFIYLRVIYISFSENCLDSLKNMFNVFQSVIVFFFCYSLFLCSSSILGQWKTLQVISCVLWTWPQHSFIFLP